MDPEAFFPDRGDIPSSVRIACGSCQVADVCLEYALTAGIEYGVWGGRSVSQRRRMKPVTQYRPPSDNLDVHIVELADAGLAPRDIQERVGVTIRSVYRSLQRGRGAA